MIVTGSRYIDPTGEMPIRDLVTEAEGSISRDSKLKIADVVINGNEYSFQVNSNGTINLIKDGLKYGTFKTSEAKLAYCKILKKYEVK